MIEYTKSNPLSNYSLDIHDLPNEEWRDIKGYEGYYQVSNKGRVKSLSRLHKAAKLYVSKERILSIFDNGHGYKYVHIGNRKMYVHRLVAMSFIDNPNRYNEINHIDENKANNKSENLEWCTHSYNASYGTKIKRTVETCLRQDIYRKSVEKKNKEKAYGAEKAVIALLRNGEEITFRSLTEASKKTKTLVSKICQCCKGQRRISNNIKWRYV